MLKSGVETNQPTLKSSHRQMTAPAETLVWLARPASSVPKEPQGKAPIQPR